MRNIFILSTICIMGIGILSAEPTARTYIFAAMESSFVQPSYHLVDSIAKYFDVVITHDGQRCYNPVFRDSNQVTWHRDEPPLLLLYKDAMTLIGPGYPYGNPDSTCGGGATVGGFWHFDTLLKQNWPLDIFFMLATGSTEHFDTVVIGNDTIHRVHAGSEPSWQWRWAMNYGEPYWQDFYGCNTKIQCLRNYSNLLYDSTYFDGIFIDNLLQWVNGLGYNMYPIQYVEGDSVNHGKFRNAVHAFAESVSILYHNPTTPSQHPSQILGIANLNNTYQTPGYDSIWRRNISVLDGGMEEDFIRKGCTFTNWLKFLHEISIAESLGKTCLMCHKVDSFVWTAHTPFAYTKFDSTDLMFGFTSYLMAFDSMACFYFTPKDSQHYTFVCRAPIYDINIGKPMAKYVMSGDTLAYRYFEESIVFTNPTSNTVTAGFTGDTLLFIRKPSAVVDSITDRILLEHQRGTIGLYPLNYFQGSGFEPDDRLCWENYCLEVQGITNYSAERVSGDPPSTVTPHSGDWMYKIHGSDISYNTSLVRFKIFPYDILIKDSTYFSCWMYVDYAPGDSAPIGIDCLLKSGKRLSEWSKYGTILDQYGREIDPAKRRVPEGAWYQYVFTFNPAVNETIDHIEVVYCDTSLETGNFSAYIDDIEILDSFPIPDCWHCEQFPTDPINGDTNFYMNFVAQDDSIKLIIDPQGDGGSAHWVEPTPRIRNNITNISVDSTTSIIWHQYDKAHSLILSLLVHDDQENNRWLIYAKNADSCWYKQGWVNMDNTAKHYNTWESFFRNIKDDYTAEYGGSVEPESVIELRLEHFARSEWNGDSGGTIRDLSFVPFTQAFALNDSQPYANMRFVALKEQAWTTVTLDSMNIYQEYGDPPEIQHYDSTGWIKYDSGYVWYLRYGEGDNTVTIRYKVAGDVATLQYSDNIYFDESQPADSLVINNNDKFTNNSNVTIKNICSDFPSGMSTMRFGNQYLKNLVKNSAFDTMVYWQSDTAIYHDSLQLFEIPVETNGNYFYQSIPIDSLSDFYNDTLQLSLDIVSDGFVGSGKVQVQYIYKPDTIELGDHPYGASITIPQGAIANVSQYNLSAFFKYLGSAPDEIRIGVFVYSSQLNSGRLYIDNLRLNPVSPYNDYTRFSNYDSLQSWTLTSGNGQKVVYGQYADSAGNETSIFFDSIIVDTTKPARRISSPQTGRKISGTVTIMGWAYDYTDPQQHFKQYELKHRRQLSANWYYNKPDSIETSPVYPSPPPSILGDWNTESVEYGDGWYDLTLIVTDSATNQRDTIITVNIDNRREGKGEMAGFHNYLYGLAAGSDIYIGEIQSGNIYKYNQDYQVLDTFSIQDSAGIGYPLAMAFDNASKLWAINLTSQTVNRYNNQGNLELRFTGNFSQPSGIAVDNSGNIWVSDRLHHKIKKFDAQGNQVFAFGTKGNEPGKINEPLGIAINNDKIYIADSKNKRISVFDTTGTFVEIIGDSAGMSLPFGIAVDSIGYLFVSDIIGNKVIEFEPYGSILYQIDTLLDSPSCLALSADEKTLYVSDTKHKRVVAYQVWSEPPKDSTGGGPMGGEVALSLPFKLESIYPNPVKNMVKIRFNSPDKRCVELKLYDATGRLVRYRRLSHVNVGMNEILIKAEHLSTGIYFVQIETANYQKIEKLILLR